MISNEEFVKFAKNIQNNSAELLNLISNQNVINKALLVRPDKYTEPVNDNDSNNDQQSIHKLSTDEIDAIFKEWDALEIKIVGKPKRNKNESKPLFAVPNNNTTIMNATIMNATNKRHTNILPSQTALRKSCENLTASSFFDVVPPYQSTPLHGYSNKTILKKSKSKDFGEMSMMQMQTNNTNTLNAIESKVTEEALNKVDEITNQKHSNISTLIETDERIFHELMENIKKLKQFLDNLESCLNVLTETIVDDDEDHANVIDSEFYKRLKSINKVKIIIKLIKSSRCSIFFIYIFSDFYIH